MTARVLMVDPLRYVDDPHEVAEHVVNPGWLETPYAEGTMHDRVVIVDGDDEVAWWLTREQALAFAARVHSLALHIPERRPLRRPADVDDHLRQLDD